MKGSSFIQHEQLSERIKDVLTQYPDGFALPKEMVQNADDANATEVHFIWDKRSHPTQYLLHSNLAEYQGPSLMIFNDAKFSNADFLNICQFGGKSKENCESKIGKFGLGFNVVYNVTDVPMLISDNKFCVFDPQFKLPDGGRAIDLHAKEDDTSVVDSIVDQLSPFECIKDFDSNIFRSKGAFSGTVFRLPLRSELQAEKSEISNIVYSSQEIARLFDMIDKMGEYLLLFTRNVREIRVSKLESNDSALTCLFSFSRKISNIQNRSSNATLVYPKLLSETTECTYEVNITKQGEINKKYIVSSYSKRPDNERIKISCTAASVSSGVLNTIYANSLFCFLPLPVHCKLPYILNGNFEISSSRRELTMKTIDDKGTKGDWNVDLIQNYSVIALFNLLNAVKAFLNNPEDVYLLFPVESDKVSQIVIEKFYKMLPSTDFELFHTFVGYQSLSHIKIIDNDVEFLMQKKVKNLFDTLYEKGLVLNPMIILPLDILKKIKEISNNAFILSFSEYFRLIIENVQALNYKDVEEIMFYSFISHGTSTGHILMESLCIKTNRAYCKPSQVVHPHGRIAPLLYFTNDYFPHKESLLWSDTSYKRKWCSIGMITDHLNSSVISECWNNLFTIEVYSIAVRRAKPFFFELNSFCQHNDVDFFKLPVLKHNELQWAHPSECYAHFYKNAVDLAFPIYDAAALDIESCHSLISTFCLLKPPSNIHLENNIRLLRTATDFEFHEKVNKFVLFIEYLIKNDIFLDLKDILCIPNSDFGFSSIQNLSLNRNDCSIGNKLTVIYPMPHQKIEKYLLHLGVEHKFSAESYISAINSYPTNEVNESICSQIITALQYVYKNYENETSGLGYIRVPSSLGVLTASTNLCINDCPWLKSESQSNTCHEMIPPIVAHHFGVKTQRHFQLDVFSRPLGKPFGQNESLTNRLRRIASQYSDTKDLYKEMLQNADDSGASLVHIVLDKTTYNTERVIAEGWEILSGPALLFYNDSCFTELDLQGIQSLGEGSKHEDYNKIGKFGVGFNCVYQVTDTPQICTQLDNHGSGSLGVFDPLYSVVKSESPGVLIDLSSSFIEEHPDSFLCFHLDALPCLEGGATFRLPFRASSSSLSENVPQIKEFERDLITFSNTLSETMLFLKNIKSIRVSVFENAKWNEIAIAEKTIEKTYDKPLYEANVKGHICGKRFTDKWIISEKETHSIEFSRMMRGSVALCLSKKISPALYCYLPLKSRSGLFRDMSAPIIFNGEFILNESRSDLCLDHRDSKSAWNLLILKDCIGHAYSNLFTEELLLSTWHLSKGNTNAFFQKLFVFNYQKYDEYDVEFNICKGLFYYLQNMNTKFLPLLCNSQVSFCSLSNAVIASFACLPKMQLLRNLCKRLNIKIVWIPHSFARWIKMCSGIDIKVCNFDYLCKEIQLQEQSNEIYLENSIFCCKDVLIAFLRFSLPSDSLFVKEEVKQMLKKLPIFLSKRGILYDFEHRPLSSRCKLSAIFPELEENCLDEEVEENLGLNFDLSNLSLSEFCKFFELNFPEFSKNAVVHLSKARFNSKLDDLRLIWEYLINQEDFQKEGCLQSLCLVPATTMSQQIFALFPFSSSRKLVVQNYDALMGISFEANLKKCKSVYKLYQLFEKEDLLQKSLTRFCINYTNICFDNVLHFCYQLHSNGEFFTKPSCCRAILNYFIRTFQSNDLSNDDKIMLKNLPIHCSIEKKYLSLHPFNTYIHIRNVPDNGLVSNENLTILHFESSSKKFYKALEESLFIHSHIQYYVNVIIYYFFEQMNMEDIATHLVFLKELINSEENSREKQELVSALTNKRFIEIKGKKYLPHEIVCLDVQQDNEIWTDIFLTNSYPRFGMLKTFFISLGVRTACTNSEILEYAKYLEAFFLKSKVASNYNDEFFQHILRGADVDENTILALSYLKLLFNKSFKYNNKLCRYTSVHNSIFYDPPEVDDDCIDDIVNLASRLDVNVICKENHPLYKLYVDRLITTKELIDLFLTKKQFTISPIALEKSSFQSKKCLLSLIKVCACEASLVEDLLSKKFPIHLSAAGMIFDDPQKLFGGYYSLIKLFPSVKHSVYEPEVLQYFKSRNVFTISDFLDYFLKDFPKLSTGYPFSIPDIDHRSWIHLMEEMWDYITKHFTEVDIIIKLKKLSLIPSTNSKKELYLLPICVSEYCVVLSNNFLEIDVGKLNSIYFLFKNIQSNLLRNYCNSYFTKYCLNEESCFENLINFLDHLKKNNEFKVNHYIGVRICKKLIAKSVDRQKIASSSRKILLELPIHKNLANNLVTLANKYFYLVCENLPRNGLELHLTGENNENIGYSTEEERKFYRKLGGLEMETEQVYVELIVPIYFKNMSQSDIYKHLWFICEHFYEDKENLDTLSRRALFYAIGHAPIIEVGKEMISISDLFDPTVKLFKIFRSNVLMPYKVFEDIEPHLQFLKHLGLNYLIDETLFLQLAFEYEIQCALGSTSNHLDEFLKYTINNKLEYTEDAFRKLQSIKILKTENFEHFGYASIESSYPFELFSCLQYVAPVASQTVTNEVSKLQFVSFLSSNAEPMKILENIKVSVSLNDAATVRACMQYILDHSLDSMLVSTLRKIPCVLSENGRWVRPQYVTRFLNFNYSPYIFQICHNFVQFWPLIHKCGGTEQLTANQCILGLSLIKKSNCFLKNPNDSIIAKRFLNILCTEHKDIDFSIVDGVNFITKDKCLRFSSDCWVCDDQLLNKYNILPDSDVIDLEFIDLPKVQIISALDAFPVALRPKFVSKEIAIVLSNEMIADCNAGEENNEIIDIIRNIQNSDILSCLSHVIGFYIFQSKRKELHESEIYEKLSFVHDIQLFPVKYIYLKVESKFEALNNVKIPHDLHKIFKETNIKYKSTIFYYTKSCAIADLFVELYDIISVPELNQAVFERLLQTSTNEERNNLLALYGINNDWTGSKDILGSIADEDCISELGKVSKIDLGQYVLVKNQAEDSYQYARLLDITEAGGHEQAESLKYLIELKNGSSTLVAEEFIFSLRIQHQAVDSLNLKQNPFQFDSAIIEHDVLNAYKNVLISCTNKKLLDSIKDEVLSVSNSELDSNLLETVVSKMTQIEKEYVCLSTSESVISFQDQFLNAGNHPTVIEYTNARLSENSKIIEDFSENDY